MSNYSSIKATIDANIKTNDNEEITGAILNSVLDEMVDALAAGYLFKGVASTSTNPGSPDEKVFYVAPPGTYTYFGNQTVPAATTGFFKWDTSWHLETIQTGVADGSITLAKLSASLATALLSTGYKFAGIASTSTNPGTPSQYVFYLGGAGTYTYFGQPTVSPGHLGVFWYDSAWHTQSVDVSIEIVNNFTDGGVDKALSAEKGKELYDSLFGEMEIVYDKTDATMYQVKSGVVADPGNRLRFVLPITSGQYVRASCSLGSGVAASIYSTEAKCIKADTDYLQTFSYTYIRSVEGQATASGYLCVSLKKTNDKNFSAQDIADYTAALQLVITASGDGGAVTRIDSELEDLDARVTALEDGTASGEGVPFATLPLGTLVQKSLTSSGLSDTNASKRVSMASNIVIPHIGGIMKFKLPSGYAVGIRSGNTAGNLSNNDYWYHNGDLHTFAASARYFRICFSKNDGDDACPLADIEAFIAAGDIQISISSELQGDIILRNEENEKYVKSVMRNFVSGASYNGSLTKLPIFAHSSDIHGDMWRLQSMMRYCDYLGVDALLLSGDMVASTPSDSNQYVLDVSAGYETPLVPCMGNHDANGLSTAQAQSALMKDLIDNVGGVYAETYPTYFYKDFTDKSIRVISLNFYETDHSGHNCNFTQTQCDWFINALATTPADYGVLVMFHAPENTIDRVQGNDDFYQDINNYWETHPGVTGNPILNIVDAFIGKTSATISYTSKSVNISTTADFTALNSGVEFIAYVNGHEHIDMVGYLHGTTHRQLNLNVCCGVAIYGTTYKYLANNSDLPRGDSGSTQDAFNVYSIDRTNKTVRIAKVGSNVSGYDLQERKYMVIPYAE